MELPDLKAEECFLFKEKKGEVMKCLKMLLWSFMAVFLVVGLFKEGVTNFTDVIVLMLLGTVLLIEGIEYKNNIKKDYRFYITFIYGLIAYFLAAYILFVTYG